MRNRATVIAFAVVLLMFAGCQKEVTTETHTISSTSADATETTVSETTVSETTTVAQSNATEELREGARQLGEGLRQGAKEIAVATGTALQRGGEKLEEAGRAPSAEASAGSAANGESIFLSKCTSCHGNDARGNTAMGKKNNIPDLRTSKEMSDAHLANVIATGKPGGLSATGHKGKATSEQIRDLIAYIRSL